MPSRTGRSASTRRPRSPRQPRPTNAPLALELLEARCMLTVTTYRPITEIGNNVANPTLGTANTDLIRIAPVGYSDGIAGPSLPQAPSARVVSNILNNQADPSNPLLDLTTLDQNSLSDFGYAFGQFMDHDMDLTPDGGASMPIPVAAGDPIGPNALPFTRSLTDPATGTSTGNPLQQVNVVTSYLDLSQVYGSDLATANSLRTFSGGLMKTSPGNLLPLDNSTYFPSPQTPPDMQNQNAAPNTDLFATGDARGNENIELTALQTLFVRNHNKIACQLHLAHPGWTDEQLYQEARKINIADYQSIVYNEWIPAVFGPTALTKYSGYKSTVNPSIANEFSTVAFRFGHSLLSGEIERHTANGLDIATATPDGASISLAVDFFDPYLLNTSGAIDPLTGLPSSDIDVILKAEADGVSQAMDLTAINAVRNLLFGEYGAGGQDLMARDVQRDRDNGIPDYNTLRAAVGLPRVTSFAQISGNPVVQQELQAAYGSVDNIDAFEGGLAEDHVAGSDVGPLFQRIMVDQFQRLRDGDRFFYLNESFNTEEQALFQQGNTLAKVITANTGVTNLQPNVFKFQATLSGSVYFNPFAVGGSQAQLGLGGVTVYLEDATGYVVAKTVTNARGGYTFTQLSTGGADPAGQQGLSATGYYQVVVAPPAGMWQYTHGSGLLLFSRGGLTWTNVNFSLRYDTSAYAAAASAATPTTPAAAANSVLVQALATAAKNTVTVAVPPQTVAPVTQVTVTAPAATAPAVTAAAPAVTAASVRAAIATAGAALVSDPAGKVFNTI